MTDFIAIDWGTSRFRAYRVENGAIAGRISSDEGMAAVPRDGFASVLRDRCGSWLISAPDAPVVMAGMVGSRNGWFEVPYVPCPAALGDIAAGIGRVRIGNGREALIVPGLSCLNDGVFDIMRGEETLIAGAGIDDGLVVQPGTHSKWARLEAGRIAGFRTHMTGEFYALLSRHSILRLLARDPPDDAGFARGLAASRRPGGLLHHAFAARTEVLSGAMTAEAVLPFLSGLLIGTEIAHAEAKEGVTLIADARAARDYEAAFASQGVAFRTLAVEDCFIAGIRAVFAA